MLVVLVVLNKIQHVYYENTRKRRPLTFVSEGRGVLALRDQQQNACLQTDMTRKLFKNLLK